jgi:hypothetical protein
MTTVQDTVHNKVAATYDIYFEIDCDCEELLDAIGLDYKQCEDDDTQNEVCISLTPAEYKESIYDLALGSCNEQTISSYILNPELGEYTTKATIYTPHGDKICFS